MLTVSCLKWQCCARSTEAITYTA